MFCQQNKENSHKRNKIDRNKCKLFYTVCGFLAKNPPKNSLNSTLKSYYSLICTLWKGETAFCQMIILWYLRALSDIICENCLCDKNKYQQLLE